MSDDTTAPVTADGPVLCLCGNPDNCSCPPAPVTTEDLREAAAAALSRLLGDTWCPACYPSEWERRAVDVVLAALAGDPGDLPARMAEAIGEALNQWSRPDAEGTRGVRRWDFVAAAALAVRWEHAAHLAARVGDAERRAEKAESEHQVTQDRLDQARRRLDLAHQARQTAEERLELSRQALARDGYFKPGEIGQDVAPRITERLSVTRDAEAAVEKARKLHQRDDSNPRGPWCPTCTTLWPCLTATALWTETNDG